VKIHRAFTVNGRTPQELFAYWRKLENLPRIFRHLEQVTERDARRSHWVAKAPSAPRSAWDAEIINEVPGELIAWRSVAGLADPNAGSVNFREAPAGAAPRSRCRSSTSPRRQAGRGRGAAVR
jgi:uncharacterized membrane protein